MTFDYLTKSEESRAYQTFAGSPIQIALHRRILDEIETHRTKLETASADDVVVLQARIRALRFALAIIHEHDTPKVKEMYARGESSDSAG